MIVPVEVRCCCEPGKLLGWLQLPQELVVEGRVLHFAFYKAPTLDPGELLPSTTSRVEVRATVRRFERTYQLQIPDSWTYEPTQRVCYLALDSGHQPLDVWRNVRGFRANSVTRIAS